MFVVADVLDLLIRGTVLTAAGMTWIVMLVRIVGLRSFSKMTNFDFVMTVATGSLLAGAAQSTSWPGFWQALLAMTALFFVQWLTARLRKDSDWFENLVQNDPVVLMREGRIDDDALKATRVARDDLIAKLREANVHSFSEVRAVVLETTGDISVLHGRYAGRGSTCGCGAASVNRSSWLWPAITAAIALALGAGAKMAIGSVYREAEAVQLIEALTSSGLYLGSAIATASATTLALMLTLLGLTRRSDTEFDRGVYVQIERVSILSTISLLSSLFMLVMLVLPVGQFDNLPSGWFPILYNILFAIVILVTATLASTVVLLFQTVRHVVAGITPGDDV